MALKIGTGITIGGGITISTIPPVTAGLVLSLDAQSYPGEGTTWPAQAGPNATLYNGVTWSESGPGYFTFVPASLQFAEAPNIGDLNQWTVECWFKMTSDFTGYDYPALVTTVYAEGGINYGYINYALSVFPDYTTLTTGYYNGTWHNTAGFAPTVGEWYQMVGVYNGATLKTYINSVEFSSVASSGSSISNGGPVRIARRWDGGGEAQFFMPAEISVVRVYNAALTAEQVIQNFNALSSRFGL